MSKIDGKDKCDSARAGVPADLKDLGSFCYDSFGRVTLNFVTPDLLPLEDKVTDVLSTGSLAIKFNDVILVERFNNANSSYNAPVIESGRLTADPKEIYCRMLANNGFVQRDMPYTFSVATTQDRMIAGSRKLTFKAGTAGPFSLSGECFRHGDTTPFTVTDLRAIFGTLAVFGPGI